MKKKLKTMLDDRYVNLEMVKELMQFKDDFIAEIDGEINSVPEFHCKECGDTDPKHGFVPIFSSCNVGYETSMVTCNKCGLTDEQYELTFKETKDGTPLIQWEAWDGRIQVLKYIDHQHLSNIHYYMNLIHPKYYEKELKQIVRETILERFGKILPYHPCPEFAYEKIRLTDLGYLDRHGDITVDGHKIGNYDMG